MELIEQLDTIILCKFTEQELIVIKNVIAEVCWGASAIDEFEFQTLIGKNREFTGNIGKQIKKIIDDLGIEE